MGRRTFEVGPGRHEIVISFPWCPFSDFAMSAIVVEARDGETIHLRYRMRMFRSSMQGASRLTARSVPLLPTAIVHD
jgi:hypothetical protein